MTLPPIQSSTNDHMKSGLDFNQGFGGINKSQNGINTTQLIAIAAGFVVLAFVLKK